LLKITKKKKERIRYKIRYRKNGEKEINKGIETNEKEKNKRNETEKKRNR
jgi:hypothetical protein